MRSSRAWIPAVALVACGGPAPRPLSNREAPRSELLVFASWEAVWQLRRDGDRASLVQLTPHGAVEYEGPWSDEQLRLRDVCRGVAAELECKWDAVDVHPAGAQMRQGCIEERERWTAPGRKMPALVCEIMGGPLPTSIRELVFVPRAPVESTRSACDDGSSSIVIRTGYRAMTPERVRAARNLPPPRSCDR